MIVTSTLSLLALMSLGADETQCSSQKATCSESKAKTVAVAGKGEILALVDKVLRGEAMNPEATGEAAQCVSNCPIATLSDALTVSPQAWQTVAAPMTKAFTCEKACPASQERIVTLLLTNQDKPAVKLAEGLLAKAPEGFSDHQAVAFAERGSKDFKKVLWQRLEAGEAQGAYGAAFFVMHSGEEICPTSLAHVKKYFSSPEAKQDLPQSVAAAMALRHAGDTEAVPALQSYLHKATLAALDQGDVEKARTLAAKAEFVSHTVASKKPMWGLAGLQWGLEKHCAKMAKAELCEDGVFDLIEKVTPL